MAAAVRAGTPETGHARCILPHFSNAIDRKIKGRERQSMLRCTIKMAMEMIVDILNK